MFLFKKIVSQFFFPLPVTLMICYAGLALLWWSKRQKAGKILVTTGLLLLTLLSYSAVSDLLLVGLERRHPTRMTWILDPRAGLSSFKEWSDLPPLKMLKPFGLSERLGCYMQGYKSMLSRLPGQGGEIGVE